MGGDPERRASIERAVESGRPTITSRTTLVQDQRKGAGIVFMLPLYRAGAPVSTPDERWAALEGLVFAPVLLESALAGMGQAADGHLDFEVFDGLVPSPANELVDFDQHLCEKPAADGKAMFVDRVFHSCVVIAVADRQ